MPRLLTIDHDSLIDNERERQIEFTAEVDGDDRDFAVKYAVLKELSGDEPEDDALELFERFSDESVDVCVEACTLRPSASIIVIAEGDLE
ncbi:MULTISPECIES: DUF1488 family protein [unclassified Sphingomonas]|uniref:DUF1488 family protein n=1 Tax=unclassified Sphingomonas TaxID=196159 RepID=UPI00226AFAF1|nr:MULTISPECIES: DUF1488 family protein [unclassified Sphingomonas]